VVIDDRAGRLDWWVAPTLQLAIDGVGRWKAPGKHEVVWGGGLHPPYNWRLALLTGRGAMSEYRRWMIPGETYFFTVITYRRRRIFDREENGRLFGEVLRAVRKDLPFRTIAMVVLPDHLHCVWSLPRGDADYSTRWKQIKRDFTVRFLGDGDGNGGSSSDNPVSLARRARGERGVWQRRFWEHVVRDDDELESFCDYIHYNPVKHGYAASPADWKGSTFARFVASGHYPPDWGRSEPASVGRVSSCVGE
jgi:putative transposase